MGRGSSSSRILKRWPARSFFEASSFSTAIVMYSGWLLRVCNSMVDRESFSVYVYISFMSSFSIGTIRNWLFPCVTQPCNRWWRWRRAIIITAWYSYYQTFLFPSNLAQLDKKIWRQQQQKQRGGGYPYDLSFLLSKEHVKASREVGKAFIICGDGEKLCLFLLLCFTWP